MKAYNVTAKSAADVKAPNTAMKAAHAVMSALAVGTGAYAGAPTGTAEAGTETSTVFYDAESTAATRNNSTVMLLMGGLVAVALSPVVLNASGADPQAEAFEEPPPDTTVSTLSMGVVAVVGVTVAHMLLEKVMSLMSKRFAATTMPSWSSDPDAIMLIMWIMFVLPLCAC